MTVARPFRAPRYDLAPDPMTGAAWSLEPLGPDDAVRLAQVFAGIDPWVHYPYETAALAAYLGGPEPDAPRFALTCAGTAVGAVGLRLNWLRGPYLQFLGIVPEAQGHGLGAACLAWLEREARAGAERHLWVLVSGFNARARAFYERHGFALAATLDDLVRDGSRELLMRKRLG
jgi:ribosomal protein S18 acetylase RimI-like enzyme